MPDLSFLLDGDVFTFQEEEGICEKVTLQLHPSRQFLVWRWNEECRVLGCCQIRDVRLVGKLGRTTESAIQLCCGTDFVNLSLLNFGSPSTETVTKWVTSLQKIVFDNRLNNLSPEEIIRVQSLMFESLLTSNKNLKKLIRFFHGKMNEKSLRKTLIDDEILTPRGDQLVRDFDESVFMELIDKFIDRPDIEEIFRQHSGGSDMMSLDCLLEFVNSTQRDSRLNTILFPLKSEVDCLEIIKKYEPQGNGRRLSLGGFRNYLMSEENMAVSMEDHTVEQDMNKPMTHYFINSSHNTYLVGRQFGGKSSVEIYRTILISGCRCVELDCWDGVDGEPIITHGMAACTVVYFRDVVKAIAESAFITSEYPVILSFENHCGYKQQKKMIDYCSEIFGDLLLKQSIEDHPLVQGATAPPPSKLKNKILIKNKKLSSEKVGEEEVSTDVGPLAENAELGDVSEVIKSYRRIEATLAIHPDLSRAINYAESTKFAGFKGEGYAKVSSFPENRGLGLLKDSSIEFVNHNKSHFSRIYPKGSRIDSSNYSPQMFWNAGCQMVALNFQTVGLPMQLNQGRFEYFGNSGYVLKPMCMRKNKDFNMFTEATIDGIVAAQCSVRIISAQFLSEKKISSYVKVEMYGLPTDTIRKEYWTKTVPENGLNPVYGDSFRFRKVVLPYMAMLKIAAYDANSNKLIGQRHLPFESIRNGYRYVTLRSEANTPLNLPMVLCHFDLSTYVPEEHEGIVDALLDPTAYISQVDRAKKMLNDLGVDDNDIDDAYSVEPPPKQESVLLCLPSIDELKQEQEYVVLKKKYDNEIEQIVASFYKRRQTLSKNQCSSFLKKIKRCNSDKAAELNRQQKEEYNRLVGNQESRLHSKKREMIDELHGKLVKLAIRSHGVLKKKFEKISRSVADELLERQTKLMTDTPKFQDVSKAEKQRRMKENKESSLNKFIEERTKMKCERVKEEKRLERLMEDQLREIEEMHERERKELGDGGERVEEAAV